ncbi:hypothetical protein CVD25_17435 [Bacillus canaveralius]|uniref:Uncharacterized protein n=1 Tax=Bacillus canaveralius TaxID=1403243 RepID=A0A2N5GQ34_9BACI|nr:hypothetical protein [Bacillus canaveralius]PLR84987.1 hypothetical protein CU635_05025 [Bacillus canaveralius]PLR93248.1 hypothetical protein CVD25_17435 [Bacillus canaveralius]RSK52448.1 hypothetical protein EJA13_10925 [Bacillus canaveralius]
MTNFLLALVSLIILMPIIYFLPLGLSHKGKMTVILAAFLLALLGLFLNNAFELWQTALGLASMIGIFAYIGANKLQSLIFKSAAAHDKGKQPFSERVHTREQYKQETNDPGIPALPGTEPLEQRVKEDHDKIADWSSIPAFKEAGASREELEGDHEFLNVREAKLDAIDVSKEIPAVSYMAEMEELLFDKKENDLIKGESQ